MNHSHKRILSLAMAAAMSLCALPQGTPLLMRPALVASAEDMTYEDLIYTVNNDGVKITKYTGTGDTLVIPDQIDGVDVTEIETMVFLGKEKLKSITLPCNLRIIGSSSFNSCTGLTEIIIPDTVKFIYDSAFAGCTALTKISIPDGTVSIGSQAFSSCSKLKDIDIPASVTSIGGNTFYGTEWLADKQEEDPLVIVNDLLVNATTVSGDVVIPSEVRAICGLAFSMCKTVTGVEIPDSVTSIGENAFYECSSLKSVSIPDSVTSIGYAAFQNCTKLTEISIPDSVTELGGSAFFGCSGLESVILPSSLESISNSLFSSCSSLSRIEIPENVKLIDSRAFASCSSLTKIFIPDGVESINYMGFCGCSSLEKVIIPDSVTTFGPMAFSLCPKLTVYGNYGSAAQKYAANNNIAFKEINPAFTDASLTLSDDLGLNFFLDKEIVNDANADNFRVRFSGKCDENETAVDVVKKNGRYCATANVSADNMNENITATLERNSAAGWEAVSEYTYSVSQYLENVETENQKLEALVDTVKDYGEVSKAYFNGYDMPEVKDYSAEYSKSAYSPVKNEDDKISLVLDSKLAVRLYIDGLKKDDTASCGNETLDARKGSNGEYYFEIAGICPTELDTEYSIRFGSASYTFKPLSWCYLVEKNGLTGKNKAMADILYQYSRDAAAYKASL